MVHTKSTIQQNTNIFPILLGKYLPLFVYSSAVAFILIFRKLSALQLNANFFHFYNCRNWTNSLFVHKTHICKLKI